MKEARILAFLSGGRRTFFELLFCALAGWAYTVIFEVLSWHVFAWIGLVPLLAAVYSRSGKRAFLYGFVWGYFWHLGSFFWLREILFPIPFAMAAVLGIFNGIFAMFIPFLFKYLLMPRASLLLEAEKRNAFPAFSPLSQILFSLAAATLWTVLEYIRSHIFTGLPWNLLGASQWKMFTIIQIADLTGVYGITFLIVLVNASLFPVLLFLVGCFVPARSPLRTAFPMPCPRAGLAEGEKPVPQRPVALLLALALVAASGSYSIRVLRKYGWLEETDTLYAGVVQPDLSQRRHGGEASTREALAVCVALSEELFLPGKKKPHVVIWPESAVPCPFNANLEMSTLLRGELLRLIRTNHVPFLFGGIRLDTDPGKQKLLFYNSALLWEEGNILSSFDKVHIVPFGEFVPLGDRFPVLNRIVGMGRNLSRGKHFQPLKLPNGARAGVSICYEDVFPYVSCNHVLNGANMLLTITNDAWYPASNEPAQHFANSVFRAVECRLPFLRVGNMDYSCVITPAGRVSYAFAKDAKGRFDPSFRGRKSGVFPVPVPRKYEPTFYVKYGDVFSGICTLLLLFLLVLACLNWKSVKNALLETLEKEKEKRDAGEAGEK